MAQDPAYQPQPDPKDKDQKRGTAAEQGAPSLRGPDELHDVDIGDEKAEKALKQIDKLQRKLEPRG
jgi:hypothetical protein